MSNAIAKYGWGNIEHTVLYEGLTQEAAEKIEIQLIADWDLTNPNNGYNYAIGGTHPRHTEITKKKIGAKSLGRKHSDEFKEWISEHNRGANNYMYGKHHSEETKRKISEAKKGTVSNNKGKFGSIVEASAEMGICKSCLQAALHKKQKMAGGYAWRYANG